MIAAVVFTYITVTAPGWRDCHSPSCPGEIESASEQPASWSGSRTVFSGARIEADLDSLPALQVERDALWARLEAATFLTLEERRRMAGVGV